MSVYRLLERVIVGIIIIILMTVCEIRAIVENIFSGRLKNPPEKIYDQYYSDRRGNIHFWFSTDASGKNRLDTEHVYKLFGAYRYDSKAEGYFVLREKRKSYWG